MKTGLKLLSCEKHTIRVFYPVGQVCPACFPEMYPKLEDTRINEPTTLEPLESRVVYIAAGSPCQVCDGKGEIEVKTGTAINHRTCMECQGLGVVYG